MNSTDSILELRACLDAVETVIEQRHTRHVRRVLALAETASTQDAAAALAGGESGVLVIAGRQTAGRGRLGRVWTQHENLGVAASLSLAAAPEHRPFISLAAGLAAALAVEDVLTAEGIAAPIGIRWPNDVVERTQGRKLAGVLIESREGSAAGAALLLVGIGINVAQRDTDWPDELRGRAASLRQLGSNAGRPAVLAALVHRLDECLTRAFDEGARGSLVREWSRRDVLLHTEATFRVGPRVCRGVVEAIEPTLEVRVRQPDGLVMKLPAATATLVLE